MGQHTYETVVAWTGNLGTGTSSYRDYSRDHEISADGRPAIPGTSDPFFRGDKTRWNPEQLLVTSLSECHMLWYLHLCAEAGVVVVEYVDHPVGFMTESGREGHFTGVVLRPRVVVASSDMVAKAGRLHEDAHDACFIASSVNFPIRHEPTTESVENNA